MAIFDTSYGHIVRIEDETGVVVLSGTNAHGGGKADLREFCAMLRDCGVLFHGPLQFNCIKDGLGGRFVSVFYNDPGLHTFRTDIRIDRVTLGTILTYGEKYG